MDYPEHLQKFIPPGFDLEKYEVTKDMDLFSWYVNLLNRPLFENLDNLTEGYIKHLENVISGGAIVISITDEDRLKNYEHKENVSGNSIPEISVVRELSILDVLLCVDDIEYRANKNDIRRLYDVFMNQDNGRFLAKEIRNIRPYEEDNEFNDWLKVDLACSDKEIKQSFDYWLKETRKKMKTKEKKATRRTKKINEFSKAKLRGWYLNKVLPYLDLISWNKLKGNHLTSPIAGEILCSQENDPTASINDTIKPLVKQLQSRDMSNRMLSVLYEEDRQEITRLTS